jgi:peptidoglycan/LPS O-acetylase OafA/YrhL
LNKGLILPERFKRIAPIAVFLLFAILGFYASLAKNWMNYFGFTMIDLFSLLMLFSAVDNPGSFFSNSILQWMGRRSYGIYVYHYPIFGFLDSFRVQHDFLNLVLITVFKFGLVLAAAAVSFRFMETPILDYKRKYQTTETPLPSSLPPILVAV